MTENIGCPNIITSAAQSAARNKPGGSDIAKAKRDVMQSWIRELSLTQRQIESRQIFGFFDAGKLNLKSPFFPHQSVDTGQSGEARLISQ